MIKKSRLIYLAPGFFPAVIELLKLCHAVVDLVSKVVNYGRIVPKYCV